MSSYIMCINLKCRKCRSNIRRQSHFTVYLCNTSHHANAVLAYNGSLSNSNGHIVGSDFGQVITTGNRSAEENSVNLDSCCNTNLGTVNALVINTKGLTAKKTVPLNLDNPTVNADIDTSFTLSSNSDTIVSDFDQKENISEPAVIDDEPNKVDDTVNGNLNPQTYILQNKIPEDDIVSAPKRFQMETKVTQSVSSASIGVVNVLFYKILVVFAMCCTSGCLLLPIILYYAMQTRTSIEMDAEYSHGKNATVSYK